MPYASCSPPDTLATVVSRTSTGVRLSIPNAGKELQAPRCFLDIQGRMAFHCLGYLAALGSALEEEKMLIVSVRERGKEEHRFTFRKNEVLIGRLRASDIILPKRNISKKHARLILSDGDQVLLEDLGSTNGSYINGKRVVEPTPVGPGDKVFMGDYIIQVRLATDEAVGVGESVDAIDSSSGLGQQPTVSGTAEKMFRDEGQRIPGDVAGPSTTELLDPLAVPLQAPAEIEEPLSPDELSQSAATMQLSPDAKVSELAPDAAVEEVLDIEVIEKLEEGEAGPTREVKPDLPTPSLETDQGRAISEGAALEGLNPEEFREAPVQATAQALAGKGPGEAGAASFLPSASRLEVDTASLLDLAYDFIAEQYGKWSKVEGEEWNRETAVRKLAAMLGSYLGSAVSASQVETLARQVYSELTGFGVIDALLSDARVGEVYVATSGRILVFDWRGELIDSSNALSCPAAAARLASRLARGGAGGFTVVRLSNGTLVRVLTAPAVATGGALRFVRPFQTTMSLAKLQNAGMASKELCAKMREVVEQGRRVVVAGRQVQANALVLHSLASVIRSDCKTLVSGDRFAPSLDLQHWTAVDLSLLNDPARFGRVVSDMDYQWMVLEGVTGSGLRSLIRISAETHIPFLASAKLDSKASLGALLAGTSPHEQTEMLPILEAISPVLVMTERGEDGVVRVEGVYLFGVERGRPKVKPMLE